MTTPHALTLNLTSSLSRCWTLDAGLTPARPEQKVSHLTNDARLFNEVHVVVRVRYLDDARRLYLGTETLERAVSPFRQCVNVAIELFLLGGIQRSVVGHSVLRRELVEDAKCRRPDSVVVGRLQP